MLETDHPEFKTTKTIDSSTCEEVINESNNKAYDTLDSTIREPLKDYIDEKTMTCFMAAMKSIHLAEEDMKQFVLLNSGTLTDEEMKKNLKKITHLANGLMKTCRSEDYMAKKLVKDLFRQAAGIKDKTEEVLIFDYCKRKFVVDNHLVDTNTYTVKLNPTNLDVSKVNCEDVIKRYDNLLKSNEYADEYEKCFHMRMLGPLNRNAVWKIFVMSELEITDEQKKIETVILAESFKQLNISECKQ